MRLLAPLLCFSQVTRRHARGASTLTLLQDVSFELQFHCSAGVYGPPRSGKSTLLRLACGLEQPDSGSIVFEGQDIGSLQGRRSAQLLRWKIALVAEETWLPGPRETALDHVAVAIGSRGLSVRQARRIALGTLHSLGASSFADQRATSLSIAQRALVALGRALVRGPSLLIVDEPTPMPSIGERERFLSVLRGVCAERGIGLLVASEDLSCLQGLQSIMSISDGELRLPNRPATVLPLVRRTVSSR